MSADNGGPAFPADGNLHNGMTLRDWFAGQVAAAAMVNARNLAPGARSTKDALEGVAQISYELADAMLAARRTK